MRMVVDEATRKVLLALLTEVGAVIEGHFLLASGRHTNRYVEKFALLRWPKKVEEICRLLLEYLPWRGIDVVVGPTTGGMLLAFECARQLDCAAAYAERVATGSTQRVIRRGSSLSPGSRVLVVDDVLTTGGSLRETLRAVREHPVEVIGAAVLVNRSSEPVELDVPVVSLLRLDLPSWPAEMCPLCEAGQPLLKPGSTSPPGMRLA